MQLLLIYWSMIFCPIVVREHYTTNVNVWFEWVYLSEWNIPRAVTLTLGNDAVLNCIVICIVCRNPVGEGGGGRGEGKGGLIVVATPLALLILLQEKQREAYQQQLLELEHKQQHFSLDNRFQDSYANPAAPKMGDDKGRHPPPPTPCGLSSACLSPCTRAVCYSSEARTWAWSPYLTRSCAGLPCVYFFCCVDGISHWDKKEEFRLSLDFVSRLLLSLLFFLWQAFTLYRSILCLLSALLQTVSLSVSLSVSKEKQEQFYFGF